MNHKLIEAAMGMLARVIPAEEYAKANAALGQIVNLLETLNARAERTEKAAVLCANHITELSARVEALELAAGIDSPAYKSAQAERAMWLVPGSTEAALAPAIPGVINDH